MIVFFQAFSADRVDMDTSSNVAATAEPTASTSDNKAPSLTTGKKQKESVKKGKSTKGQQLYQPYTKDC